MQNKHNQPILIGRLIYNIHAHIMDQLDYESYLTMAIISKGLVLELPFVGSERFFFR